MARIRTKPIKIAARVIVANYWEYLQELYDKLETVAEVDRKLAGDLKWEFLKKLVDIVAETPSKRIRNRIAGYIVRIMHQILDLERISIDELKQKYGPLIGRSIGRAMSPAEAKSAEVEEEEEEEAEEGEEEKTQE